MNISNNPPDMAVTAAETANDLNDWMKENPVIESEEAARAAKVFIDRAKLCIKDLEDERDKKVRPLNDQVNSINDYYRKPRNTLRKIADEIQERVAKFLRQEEAKRIAAAREAARLAQEAEQRAREAERAEQEAIKSAESGVLDIDIKAAVTDADAAFSEYEKAARQAAIAQKDAKVKIGGGFARAIGLRTQETLTVTDPMAAIGAIGMNEYISEAIIKSARAYKKLHDKYPPGIQVSTERKVV